MLNFSSARRAAPGSFRAVGLKRTDYGFKIVRKKDLLNLKTAKFAALAWRKAGLTAYVYDDKGEQVAS